MTTQQEAVLANTIKLCRERNVILPTYKQMRDPSQIPVQILGKLKELGLWDLHPANLFRISWKNEPVESGGGFDGVNHLELPSSLTGVSARVIVLLGKYFPTGAHKVGATFGPLVEKLISGRFDPTTQKALWPSTGNYCRGGAYDAYLLGCGSIAVLPEEMSKERFEWLEKVGSEIISTPGGESNVKEIYDKVKALEAERGDKIVTLNQFAEFGNPLWHYAVTGPAMGEVFESIPGENNRLSGLFLTQGSAGTLGSGEYLKQAYPTVKVGAGEALQCPTLLYNGYGAHRIEGIGDKHVPWIHNVKSTDFVAAIDDETTIRLMRLFNEPEGHAALKAEGVPEDIINHLSHLGISGIANMAGAIKMAKYYEWNERDVVFTVATDSMDMYQSRMLEEREKHGQYTSHSASADLDRRLQGLAVDNVLELSHYDRKRMHNLKYFTWVEQQGKDVAELDAQWYDDEYWTDKWALVDKWDEQIEAFNEQTGLMKH
jgi:cysteine synthase